MKFKLIDKELFKQNLKAINLWWGWAWIAGLMFISALMIANILYIKTEYGYPESPGVFGDSFGGVGALFSGIALIGIIITLREQQNQILAQKSFLARSEMNDTFFKLLEIFGKVQKHICANMDDKRDSPPINDLYNSIRIDSDKSAEEIFSSFELKHKEVLDSYFRTLKYMLKFLKSNPLEDAETRLYSNLLRTQISQEEAGLIFLNLHYRKADPSADIESRKVFISLVQHFRLLVDIKDWERVDESIKSEINRFIDTSDA
jgi:hypothetical protein